ncbi:MAG: hypothetical protein D6814_08025 [Calditrichaeota bacterium]|nr:MAG: hypothetical protein D6814_08025 [Calditrichota bacterium]
MIKRFAVLLLVVVLALPISGFGQLKSQQRGKINFASLLNGGLRPQGLIGLIGLDPSRFHMSQSYSLSFMNFGGKSFSQGVYLNNLSYQFSIPLTLNLEWGMSHSPLAAAGLNSAFKDGFFLSGASLEYKPSKSFQIGVQYSAYPTAGYGYGYPGSYLGQPWRPDWRR